MTSPFTRPSLEADGFSGFVTFDMLRQGQIVQVPSAPGTYVVLREKDEVPVYLDESIGGWFKGRDPTVSIAVLGPKWLAGCHVVYIGKAKSLATRIEQYMKFGAGQRIGHWGGRYIWQLSDSRDLIIGWKACRESETHSSAEAALVCLFKDVYGRLPFANIADPSNR